MEYCYEWVKKCVLATMFNPKNKNTEAGAAKFAKLFETEENKKVIDEFLTGKSGVWCSRCGLFYYSEWLHVLPASVLRQTSIAHAHDYAWAGGASSEFCAFSPLRCTTN